MIFAEVAVPVPARAGALFSYSVPSNLRLCPGQLAVVPFSSRVLPAVVVHLSSTVPDYATREVMAVVEDAPILDPDRVGLALWIAERYYCSPFDALRLMLPPGWQKSIVDAGSEGGVSHHEFRWPSAPLGETELVRLAPEPAAAAQEEGASSSLSPSRRRVAALLAGRGVMPAGEVAGEARCALATVRRMVSEGTLVRVDDGARMGGGDGSLREWLPGSPHPNPLPEGEGIGGSSPSAVLLDERARGEGGVSNPLSPWERARVRASSLPRRGVRASAPGSPPIVLNPEQAAAYVPMAAVVDARSHRVFLLQGVTGSGKTHVYLKLIEKLISQGRRALVLVSEIAQTPEALDRYTEHFPGRVAMLHSGMAPAERTRQWREIYEGRYDVVIGPRSALFAPLPDLGLVILDEEHEPAYKQDEMSPRYHARDVAIELARRKGAVVVLGSATPDVCSYWLAQQGVYQLETLPGRYAGPSSKGWSSGMLPSVEVVDLRTELRSGNTGIFSRALKEGLAGVLAAGEQAILFLNRRGASTAVVCRDCGYVVKCRRCDVPLVLHREREEMVCHQCNRRTATPQRCPKCKGNRISFFGAGTERVAEEVLKLFPSARVLRWDADVTGARGAHEQLHRQIRDRKVDFVVGTQMVAKALDFPMVTLVGVLLADITLHLPDLRAAERTFQLLAQVAGRAGRGERPGRVVLQTYSPEHYSVVTAALQDYQAFYEEEIEFRRRYLYPPFRRLARLQYSGAGEVRARTQAMEMAQGLQRLVDEHGIPDLELMGPAPSFHSRLRGRYRWQIVAAGDGIPRLLERIRLPLGWTVDVDPVSML